MTVVLKLSSIGFFTPLITEKALKILHSASGIKPIISYILSTVKWKPQSVGLLFSGIWISSTFDMKLKQRLPRMKQY